MPGLPFISADWQVLDGYVHDRSLTGLATQTSSMADLFSYHPPTLGVCVFMHRVYIHTARSSPLMQINSYWSVINFRLGTSLPQCASVLLLVTTCTLLGFTYHWYMSQRSFQPLMPTITDAKYFAMLLANYQRCVKSTVCVWLYQGIDIYLRKSMPC